MNSDIAHLTILVVEDDVPTQKLLETVLRRAGYACQLAANGREAIALLQQNDYAAIVLDLMMPAVGGREVIDFLAEASSRIPVVVCSAAGPAALTGFDPIIVKAVIRKPFDVDHFVAIVAAAVQARRP